jgi:putative redox protein
MDNAERPDVVVTWTEGLQFVGNALASKSAIVLDGASEHGGQDSGPQPMEALLISLGACTGMDVISILQKKRQQVTGFRLNIRGDRAEEFPKRYTRIEIEFVVRGWNVSEEAAARSVELSQTKYCPVTATLGCPVEYSIRIEQEQAP